MNRGIWKCFAIHNSFPYRKPWPGVIWRWLDGLSVPDCQGRMSGWSIVLGLVHPRESRAQCLRWHRRSPVQINEGPRLPPSCTISRPIWQRQEWRFVLGRWDPAGCLGWKAGCPSSLSLKSELRAVRFNCPLLPAAKWEGQSLGFYGHCGVPVASPSVIPWLRWWGPRDLYTTNLDLLM